MRGTNINVLGKKEKNKKVMEGDCIFPFKYQWKDYNECVETEKGKICATSTSDRGTLKTYGYCDTNRSLSGVEKGTKKKAPKKTLKKWKLKIVDRLTQKSKSKSKYSK